MKDMKFQKSMVKQLRDGKLSYKDASIYTILFDLVKGSSLEEVAIALHSMAIDLGKRKKLEKKFKQLKSW